MVVADASLTPARRMLRLRLATWVWLLGAAACMVVAVVPGSRAQPFWRMHQIEHGWPWIYMVRDVRPWGDVNFWAVAADVADFYPLALAADLLVCAAILVAITLWRERKAARRGPGPRRYARIPWRLLFDGFLIGCIAVSWFLAQLWLADGNSPKSSAAAWWRTHLGDEAWLLPPAIAVLIFGAWFARRYSKTKALDVSVRGDLFPLSLALIFAQCHCVWIVLRTRDVYGAVVPMLVDLVAMLLCAGIVTGILRRWRASRQSRKEQLAANHVGGFLRNPQPRWQFSLRCLLIMTTAAALFITAGVEVARFVDAVQLRTADDRYPPPCPRLLLPLYHSAHRLHLTNEWYDYYAYAVPQSDRDLARLQYLMRRYPRAVTLTQQYWDFEPQELANLSELHSATMLDLAGLNEESLAAMTGFKRLEGLIVQLEEEHSPETKEPVERIIQNNGGLRGLFLFGVKFDEANMKQIANAPDLEYLHLTWTPAGYSGLLPDPEFIRLQYDGRRPDQARGPISDEGLQAIGNLKSLETLRLEGTQITGPGLAHLQSLPRQRHLAIENAPLGNNGVAWLNGLSHLVSLRLARTEVTTLAALDWNRLPRLRRLDLSHTDIPVEEVRRLRSEHPRVVIVHNFVDMLDRYSKAPFDEYLWNLSVSDPLTERWRWIQKLKLASISLRGSSVVDADLARLAPLSELLFIDLSRTRIGNEGLAHLAQLPTLEGADLNETFVDDLSGLRDASSLVSLSLNYTNLDDRGAYHLASMTSLKELRIHNTRVSGMGLTVLAYHPTLENLTVDAAIVDATLVSTLKTMPSLLYLTLVDDHFTTAEKAAAVLRPQLPGVMIGP